MSKSKFKKRNKAAEKPKYWVRLTRVCNNNCIFCLDKENRQGAFLRLKKIKDELKKGRDMGTDKLILSGGEPSIHPHYLDIIKYGRSIGYQEIQTVTNGRMFAYKDFLNQAIENGLTEVTVSIHGHTRELYEKQSGIKGSYEQALAGLINALDSKKLIVNIDIVINKINYKYLEKIIRFFISLGVYEFDLLQLVPFGAAWMNKNKVFFNMEKAVPYLKKAFSLQHEFPYIYLWTNRFPAQYLEGFEELIQHPIKLYDELRGRRKRFERFLKKKSPMKCYGEQCQYCFIENFCKDLMELKKTKRIKSRSMAYCLKKKYEFNEKNFIVKDEINLEKFLGFYIEYRYFLKSLRCKECRYFKECDGAPINLIREKGFKILRPIKD